jgi:hypothetical protein
MNSVILKAGSDRSRSGTGSMYRSWSESESWSRYRSRSTP